ncbi:lysophospholipase [Erwinia sp. OLTSP20]|uniref:alpha/beta hydrolase n=1 Tax=unclassified Erwinia TaxID=2622719 RepID=UPI000C17AEE9|nr:MULTISPECIES: alpha/beta hydrolase [unclassified Erwinia]PIJ50992.1 lysophospholipase [Erwinia sp. OAMSP11]PIJ73740.1 lysophospholipase [Erwinia sp. OLSSP12]PIJ83097.1 lysophospholipase [Erwinia sp. OLCASP19]PIJ85695.1 lysophospholipase [Erwinia sp. OLMTSP26]PIJ87654.1 lysophospholipase [Erwinia sp. OLMDSP33]
MTDYKLRYIQGHNGEQAMYCWLRDQPRFLALLVHGYGEHLGRYHHVANALQQNGACVFGPDHCGHGLSQGERVLIEDVEAVVDDVHKAVFTLRTEYPGLPLVIIGHSMGGLIATRYVQRHPYSVSALVLSGPLLGKKTAITDLAAQQTLPDTPLDPNTLSRDPTVGAAYQADPLVWHGPFKRATLNALQAALTRIDHGAGFGALPLLWMHGADDKLVLLSETQPAINKLHGRIFEAEIWPGARHEIFNETNQQQVIERMISFIRAALRADA